MRRILVVKLADIGDVLTATPALRALRRTFPHAHITALIPPHCRELLEGSPLVNELILLDKRQFDTFGGTLKAGMPLALARVAARLRGGRFDAVLMLHHLTTPWGAAKYAALALASGAAVRAGLDNGRGWFLTHRARDHGFGVRHEVEYCNDVVGLIGAKPDYGPMEFPLVPEDMAYAQTLLPSEKHRIALHAGSGAYSLARRWPLERFSALARQLASKLGAHIILVGGSDEVELSRVIAAELGDASLDLTGSTTLHQLGAVLKSCNLFVGNDSGVMHLAAAVGTPVVAIFGPSNHRAWGPWAPARAGAPAYRTGRPAVVLRADLPCMPCFYTAQGLGTPEGCPNRTCLQLVTPQQVAKAVEDLLTS